MSKNEKKSKKKIYQKLKKINFSIIIFSFFEKKFFSKKKTCFKSCPLLTQPLNDPLFGKGGKEAEFQKVVLGDSYFFGLIKKSCFMNFFRCLSKKCLKIGF